MGPETERLTILRAATYESELGNHDFCLSRSYYTDTDPTSRERPVTAGIEPGTSSPGVARSTDCATALPATEVTQIKTAYLEQAVRGIQRHEEIIVNQSQPTEENK